MHIENLSPAQVSEIYREHLRFDFPPDETKPLAAIVRAMNRGCYVCYGLFDGGCLTGYAFYVRVECHYLLDYLAIVRGKRNAGSGSLFLKLLAETLTDAGSIIAEIEDPEAAENIEDREIRIRRWQFYRNNGCTDTGVRACTFGVSFRILRMDPGPSLSEDQIRSLYRRFYAAVLPEDVCRSMVVV